MMYDRPKSLPAAPLNIAPSEDVSGNSSIVENFVDSPATEVPDHSLLEYGQCALKGFLYKKERFMTWVKLFCIIRNNFLECHKSHGNSFSPVLKLFLPGSEIKEGGGDAKKKWALQVSYLILCMLKFFFIVQTYCLWSYLQLESTIKLHCILPLLKHSVCLYTMPLNFKSLLGGMCFGNLDLK